MIRILPEGIGVIPLFNNITRGDRAEFKEVMRDYDEKVAILAEQGCDVIHLKVPLPLWCLAMPAKLKRFVAGNGSIKPKFSLREQTMLLLCGL